MSSKVRLLDCTLRDGAYIVESNFGETAIRGIIDKLREAEVDIIECGWLKDKEHRLGSSFYHVPDDLRKYMSEKNPNSIYTVMIDWDRYNLDYLPKCDGKSIDAVRVVFPHEKYREGIDVGRRIHDKGYKVFYQAANTLAYSDDELNELAHCINSAHPVSLSVVDTFGAMYEEDLERIVSVLDRELDHDIQLGFHSHNNQQLSFALTMHFTKLLADSERDIIVDASLCGMGRGAGNATTELVANFLNRKCSGHYDLDAIMDAIDVYMSSFQKKYEWGYSTPYYIAGMYCCHVNNIAYLLNNHHSTSRDMRNIIESLEPSDRRKYDYDLLESKYIANQSRMIDDSHTVDELKKKIGDRTVVLIAPGKSSLTDNNAIKRYISEHDAVTVGVNAIVSGYVYDYLFFVNAGRYDYADKVAKRDGVDTDKILLSNIKTEAGPGEHIIAYNNAIKRGWEHFDNAVICALRLMDYLGIKHVAIAGFDGFKDSYNESYADPMLPTINPGKKWVELNEEIRSMYSDFKRNAHYCTELEFITESLFDC